jgi:hypothetical protein
VMRWPQRYRTHWERTIEHASQHRPDDHFDLCHRSVEGKRCWQVVRGYEFGASDGRTGSQKACAVPNNLISTNIRCRDRASRCTSVRNLSEATPITARHASISLRRGSRSAAESVTCTKSSAGRNCDSPTQARSIGLACKAAIPLQRSEFEQKHR